MTSERTPLTGGPDYGPPYVFVTNPNRLYRKQIREFQCCVCSTILLIVLTALIASITYSVDNDTDDLPTNSTNSTPVAPQLSLKSLMSQSYPLLDLGEGKWKGPVLNKEQIQEAVDLGRQEMASMENQSLNGPALPVDSPSYRHQQSIRTSMEATKLSASGILGELATKHLSKGTIKGGSIGKGPAFVSCDDESGGVKCETSPYRTYDGVCNNLEHKTWGSGMQPFKRDLPPDYADGISAPRANSDGSELPSAREVSVTIHRPEYRDDPKFSVMLAVWGQFMDHDVTATALTKAKDGGTITCCGVPKESQHPACYPVELKAGDSYYHKYNMTCMEFVRSAPAPACTLGPREQLNQVSSFLDGSVVYGNNVQLANRLRTFQGGELKMLKTPDGRELLPISTDPTDGCNEKEQNAQGRYCFMTGDARANENTHLTSMHLLMARQHNTIARQFATINPDWDDETVYQQSRRVLAAQMQHITYNEFLPVLLGPSLMSNLKLNSEYSGYWNGYNSSVDPTVSNNFATSAFRFAHTLIPGLMKILANDTKSVEYVELHKMLFNPYEIYSQGGLDKTLKGAMTTNIERADNYFTKELTEHLFEQVGSKIPYGLDLVSLNIQRGRDHGLPGYTKWRKYCGLSEPKTFDDLQDHVDEESLNLLKSTYKTVEDIDMYTGGLSEKPIEGGILGPTITCLVANQFVRMKMGDRYWYETSESPQAFTEAQLDEVRKTTLAGIICQNSDSVQYSQRKVMELVSEQNPRIACSEIAQPDLTQWMSKSLTLKLSAGTQLNVTKFGSKVASGSVLLNDGKQVWNGELPVEIPLPSTGVQANGRFSVDVSAVLKTTALNSAEFSGKFIIDSTKTGSFKFDIDLFWINTNATAIDLSSDYSLEVIFAERGNFSYLLSSQLLAASSATSKAILYGHYVKNNTAFIWNGNVTGILIPSPNNSVPLLQPLQLKSSPLHASANEPYETPCFGVSNGRLSVNNEVVWAGVTPVSIPIKYSQKANKTNGFGYYAILTGSLEGNNFVGTYSIPDSSSPVPLSGEFAFRIVELNVPVNTVLKSNVTYRAKLLFRESDGRSIVDWAQDHSWQKYAYDNNSDSWNWILSSKQGGVVDQSISIVLQGLFSADKTSFSWSGNCLVYSHDSSAPAPLLGLLGKTVSDDKPADKKDDKPDKGLVFGAHVSYATITGGVNGAPPEILHDGPFPEITYIGPVFVGVAAWERSIPVTWKGKLEGNTITGNYSAQIKDYVLAGTFTAQVTPTFKPFPPNLISPGSDYSTSVSFKQYNSLSLSSSMTPLSLTGVASNMILVGTFSPDSESFYFPGDLTFTIGGAPKPTEASPLLLQGLKDSDTKKKTDKKKDKDKKKPDKGETLGAMVKGAYITAGLNGSNPQEIFSGKPPMMTYIGDIFAGMPSWQRGINILWKADISGNTITGNYSTVVQGELYAGSFSFDLSPMWVPKLDLSLIRPNTAYATNCLFTQWGKSAYTVPSASPPKPVDNNLQMLFSSAQQLTLGAVDSSLIIVGTFSPDGTSFYFPGSIRFIKTPIPTPNPVPPSIIPTSSSKPEDPASSPPSNEVTTPADKTPAPLQLGNSLESSKTKSKTDMYELPGWYNGKLAVKVLGGYVTAAKENRPTETWWYEVLPAEMPANPFWTPTTSQMAPPDNSTVFSHGIIWSATDIGEYNIKGTFSMPQYVRSGDVFAVQWFNGEFNFRFSPLWNSAMNDLVALNVKYYSPLHMQSTNNPILQSGPTADVINSAKPAPIILLGNQTVDTFFWGGGAIVAFK